VVEAAAAGGLAQLPAGLAPLTASSYGVGELLRVAIDAGASTIVLGVGGSASTDGGAGLVQALGGRVLDNAGASFATRRRGPARRGHRGPHRRGPAWCHRDPGVRCG